MMGLHVRRRTSRFGEHNDDRTEVVVARRAHKHRSEYGSLIAGFPWRQRHG